MISSILDGDLKVVQHDDDIAQAIKIELESPTRIKNLRSKSYLFVIYPCEMPHIDPIVAYNQLNVDPNALYAYQ